MQVESKYEPSIAAEPPEHLEIVRQCQAYEDPHDPLKSLWICHNFHLGPWLLPPFEFCGCRVHSVERELGTSDGQMTFSPELKTG